MTQVFGGKNDFPPDHKPSLSAQERSPLKKVPEKMRIAFIHPDLGIGGAERLVVDAAVGLQSRGHTVEIFTSHHEGGADGRSFEETRDGTLKVHVLGSSIIPTSWNGKFTIVCAILRQLHLTLSFLFACLLHSKVFSFFFRPLPLETPFEGSHDWSPRRQLEPFDVIIVDQLSACIPLLRWLGGNRVVFYCHFPDLLLSNAGGGSSDSGNHLTSAALGISEIQGRTNSMLIGIKKELKRLYRVPIDSLEEMTTGEADKILVNSEFTSQTFQNTFRSLNRIPRVVYPAVNYKKLNEPSSEVPDDENQWLINSQPTLLSINRFEGKKDLELALHAYAMVQKDVYPDLRLILAGGFDPRLPDNLRTLTSLQALTKTLGLSSFTHISSSPDPNEIVVPSIPSSSGGEDTSPSDTTTSSASSPRLSGPQVLFLLNMTTNQKKMLLSNRKGTIKCLLYTPSFEHLGIVPLEAMASGLPVLATNTGGPMETVIDHGLGGGDEGSDDGGGELGGFHTTGLLRPASAQVWSSALKDLLSLPIERLNLIGEEGRKRVRDKFSTETLSIELEKACRDAAGLSYPIWKEVGLTRFLMFWMLAILISGIGWARFSSII